MSKHNNLICRSCGSDDLEYRSTAEGKEWFKCRRCDTTNAQRVVKGWKTCDCGPSEGEAIFRGSVHILNEDGRVITEVANREHAALIAAAPELLEACKNMKRLFDQDTAYMIDGIGDIIAAIKQAQERSTT